ncbi:hypothetical protein C8Q74DRAFT_1257084 [Fomes fomentarius]|nr:hypothetical protein C8Q74DRAFT_1257084 [Fomes fomentarius]
MCICAHPRSLCVLHRELLVLTVTGPVIPCSLCCTHRITHPLACQFTTFAPFSPSVSVLFLTVSDSSSHSSRGAVSRFHQAS